MTNDDAGDNDDEAKGRPQRQWEEDYADEPGLGESGMMLTWLVASGIDNKPRVWHCNTVFNLILYVDYYMFLLVYQMIILIF